MRIVLVGADFEENLGVGMIAAVAQRAGHTVRIVTYDHVDQMAAVARACLAHRPHVVGLSMQFQHRAHDFIALARSLRACGFQGHVTCGGQFPSLAWRDVLRPENGLDTVVFNDGEATFLELLQALATGAPLDDLPGLALRTADGLPRRTAGRPLNDALDALPAPLRYRRATRHLGVPFIPIMASRGCWGACTYCSITSTFRDARGHGGGRTFRERSPENVAAEMATLWHREGGPSLFCFHDDNLLKPRPEDTLARLGAIRASLDARGVGRIGLIGKCRPDCVTPALARSLRDMGVIRLYVGVENASEMGALHLNRARQTQHVDAALAACREAGIFVCYNLLIFEPDARLDDVAENIAFIREHALHPVNFCRAEPYAGTPLAATLAARGGLSGSYLGYDYRITDDRTEILFRITSAAFRQRNFDPTGVANRYMGLGYTQVVLEHFHPELGAARHDGFRRRCRALTRAIALETADFLDEALTLARTATLDTADGAEALTRETALLGLRIAAADHVRHAELDELFADMAAAAREARAARGVAGGVRRVARGVKHLALGASLAAAAVTAAACDDAGSPSPDPEPDTGIGGMVVDPLPPDGGFGGMVADPLPPDAGFGGMVADPLPPDAGFGGMVADPLPPDAGFGGNTGDFLVVDPPPPDAGFVPDFLVVDPPPPDFGLSPDAFDPGPVDPLPPDAGLSPDVFVPGPVDPPPPDAGLEPDVFVPGPVDPPPPDHAMIAPPRTPGIDQWRDTAPRRATRSTDLPLWAPPDLRLEARAVAGAVEVRVVGALGSASTRWASASGSIEGDGLVVRWQPDAGDQIRVAIRTLGGVGVLALRAVDVRG
jgi:anaerobic magnesium-protoporphyrin IX monomethyl ester cyclase